MTWHANCLSWKALFLSRLSTPSLLRTHDALIRNILLFLGRWERCKYYIHLHSYLAPRRRIMCIINIFHACNKPGELPTSAVPSWSFTGTASWRGNSRATVGTRAAGGHTDLGTEPINSMYIKLSL